MRFSVIVTTRNRPILLRRAVASILRQTCTDFEVVVVDDGSLPEFAPAYDSIGTELGDRGRIHHLPPSASGSGPSRARNHGLGQCAGEFVAFLDDDDEWIDPDYLRTAARALDDKPQCELHLMNQEAVSPDGTPVKRPIWIEDLADKLPPSDAEQEWRVVSPADLLRSNGFCHLNTSILSRSLLQTELRGSTRRSSTRRIATSICERSKPRAKSSTTRASSLATTSRTRGTAAAHQQF